MILKDIGLIAAINNRTKSYLQNMIKFNLIPAYAIIMVSKKIRPESKNINLKYKSNILKNKYYFDSEKSISKSLEENQIPYIIIKTDSINDKKIISALNNIKQKIMIFSGYGGQILRKPLFETGKKFLHLHPGYLPDYKGSTTFYYSILKENNCGVSALFLNEKIDSGPVLMKKKFAAPDKNDEIDYYYDPMIRTKVLIDVLKKYVVTGKFVEKKQIKNGETFYIIHPVLKHISILSLNI